MRCKNCKCEVYIDNSNKWSHKSENSRWANDGCMKCNCKKPEPKKQVEKNE